MSSNTGSSPTKVQQPEMESHGAGSSPSVVSTNAPPGSAGNKAPGKRRPTSSVTSSSAGSSAIKVQKPEVKSRGTGRPSSVASTNATPGSAADKVRPESSVTRSAKSSATKVQRPNTKSHGPVRSPPVALTNATPGSAADKVQPVSSVASSRAVSATKVKPEEKSHGPARPPPPVASTNVIPGSAADKGRPVSSVVSSRAVSSPTKVQKPEETYLGAGRPLRVVMTDTTTGSTENKAFNYVCAFISCLILVLIPRSPTVVNPSKFVLIGCTIDASVFNVVPHTDAPPMT